MFDKFQKKTGISKRIATEKLDNAAGNILLKLMWHMDRFNIYAATPDVAIEQLGVSMWEFTHGIRSLKQMDCIRKYTKKEYMINPDIIFNGSDEQYYVIKDRWDNQTIEGARLS